MSIINASPVSDLPRIGADNAFRKGTISATSGTARYAVDWRADRVWAPGEGTHTITAVCDDPVECDYAFIAFHNWTGMEITIQALIGSWTTVASFTPVDDGPVWVNFAPASSPQWRVTVAAGDVEAAIAILSVGKSLALEQGMQSGWSPVELSGSSEVVDAVSEDGVLVARTLRRRPSKARMSLSNVSEAWMHSVWAPVRDRLIRQPWALSWSPNEPHARSCLAWTDGAPHADSYSGPGLLSVSWNICMVDRRDVSALDTPQEAPPEPPPLPVLIASIMLDSDIWLGEGEIADPGYILIDDYPT